MQSQTVIHLGAITIFFLLGVAFGLMGGDTNITGGPLDLLIFVFIGGVVGWLVSTVFNRMRR